MEGNNQPLTYEFNGFRLDPGRRQLLSSDGTPIPLTSRVFDTLLYLVAHRGELLDKTTLMQAVWPDTVVEENNLNQAISALRKALGEKQGAHQFILTEPGRGYRFVAEVQVLDLEETQTSVDEQPEFTPPSHSKPGSPVLLILMVVVLVLVVGFIYLNPPGTTQGPVARQEQPVSLVPATAMENERTVIVKPPLQSVAVLPFVDMSPDQDQEYFADGVAEEVLNQLYRIHGLHVVGRTSSFSFKGKDEDLRTIGEQLNVANILEGSVRKDGNRVRISAQLVKAEDGYNLWSQSYDRNLEDIFAIQEETAKAVANALSISLGMGDGETITGGTRNFAAYDAYLAGNALYYHSGRENITRAIEQFERAVTLDPDFALAWSSLAVAYFYAATVFITEKADEYIVKSNDAASQAVAIAPEAVPSLRAAALLRTLQREWHSAEQSLKKALGLSPGDYLTNRDYGIFLLDVGRPGEAIDYLRQAVRAEPLAMQPAYLLGLAYELNADFDAAMKEFDRAQGLTGNHFVLNVFIMMHGMQTGDRELMETFLVKLNNSELLPVQTRSFSTTIHSLLDSPELAHKELHRVYNDPDYAQPTTHGAIAVWASYFGEHKLALSAYRDLFRAGAFVPRNIWNSIHEPMRRLPGFKDIVRDLGLVDYWRETGYWGEFCRPAGEDDFECE